MVIIEIKAHSDKARTGIKDKMEKIISTNTFDDLIANHQFQVCSKRDILKFTLEDKYHTVSTVDGKEVSYFLPTHTGTAPFLIKHFEQDNSIIEMLEKFDYYEKAMTKNTFFVGDKKVTSISKVLGHVFDDEEDFIALWKARVGEEVANEKMRAATKRGTALHSKLEDYLVNKNVDMVFDKDVSEDENKYKLYIHRLFLLLKPKLDALITKIYGLELPLVSEKMMAGGRLDLLCELLGKLTLADFKSSDRKISEDSDKAFKYFAQMIFYCIILEELTGIKVEQVALLVATDTGDSQVLICERDSDKWNEIRNYIVNRTARFQPIFEQQEIARLEAKAAKKAAKDDSEQVLNEEK